MPNAAARLAAWARLSFGCARDYCIPSDDGVRQWRDGLDSEAGPEQLRRMEEMLTQHGVAVSAWSEVALRFVKQLLKVSIRGDGCKVVEVGALEFPLSSVHDILMGQEAVSAMESQSAVAMGDAPPEAVVVVAFDPNPSGITPRDHPNRQHLQLLAMVVNPQMPLKKCLDQFRGGASSLPTRSRSAPLLPTARTDSSAPSTFCDVVVRDVSGILDGRDACVLVFVESASQASEELESAARSGTPGALRQVLSRSDTRWAATTLQVPSNDLDFHHWAAEQSVQVGSPWAGEALLNIAAREVSCFRTASLRLWRLGGLRKIVIPDELAEPLEVSAALPDALDKFLHSLRKTDWTALSLARAVQQAVALEFLHAELVDSIREHGLDIPVGTPSTAASAIVENGVVLNFQEIGAVATARTADGLVTQRGPLESKSRMPDSQVLEEGPLDPQTARPNGRKAICDSRAGDICAGGNCMQQ